MTDRKKNQFEFSIEDLDRELIARGAQIPLEQLFTFTDSEGTPARDIVMARIKDIYYSSYSTSPALASIDTWDLARILISKIQQKEENRSRGIWYEDNRMDFYSLTERGVLKNIESVPAIMLKDNLIDEKNGFSRIKIKNYGDVFNLNEIESFYHQPISSGRLWSGFLVKKDIIATAGHWVRESNLEELRIVFGYKVLDTSTPIISVPNENIYYCIKISSSVYNQNKNGADWTLLKLDRDVQNQKIVTLTKDSVAPLQPVYVIGHPLGLPLKYAAGARVRRVKDASFLADFDIYMGSSGSPVFNSETHEVMGIVVRDDTIDFRWTGRGWISIIYPNSLFSGSLCTKISELIDSINRDITNIEIVSEAVETQKKSQIFISYSHKDREFVNQLTVDLENASMNVWVDEKKIKVGDQISLKVEEGIAGCDYFCLVISGHSVKSKWVDREYRTALNRQLSSKTTLKILPLIIENVELPSLLEDIKYANFSLDYDKGIKELFDTINKQ